MTSLETNTAGSSKPITLPPRDYIHVLSKRYFYFFFICLISSIRFVCTHSYIILHYILLRQTGRWAIFALSRREAVTVASRTCILHKPAQDDHFLRRGKNRFISRSTFVTWQKWGEVHARGLHHIHIQTVGVGKFQTYGTYKELCQHHFNWQTFTSRSLSFYHHKLPLSPMYSICKVEKNSSSCIKHRPMLNIYLSLSLSTATPYIKKTWHIMIFFFIFQGLLYYCLYTELIDMGKPSQFPVLSNILYSSQM